MAQIETYVGSGGRAAGDQRPGVFERANALVPGGGAHVFDDDVHPLFVGDSADFVRNLLLVVIDAVVGAKSSSLLKLGLIAGGRDHAAVKHLRNLNRGNAYSRACA